MMMVISHLWKIKQLLSLSAQNARLGLLKRLPKGNTVPSTPNYDNHAHHSSPFLQNS
jgi:hypothetical protein